MQKANLKSEGTKEAKGMMLKRYSKGDKSSHRKKILEAREIRGKKEKIKNEGQPTITQTQKTNLKSEGSKEAQGMMLKKRAKGIKVSIERKSYL